MDSLLQDLRHAVRALRQAPAFALAAILTLGLGIGANTAIFSVVNGVLLRPLAFPDPERLVTIWGYHPSIGRETASLPDYLDWRRDARSFGAMAAWANTQFTVTGTGEPEVARGALVTADYFRVLGVTVPVGRDFRPEEERGGAARTAVLGHGYWQRRFGGRADVVGRQIVLGGVPHTIVGVGARGLALPEEVEVYAPLVTDTTLGRRSDFLQVIGRLGPGADVARAREEMTTIGRRLAQAYPQTNAGWGAQLIPLHERIVAEIRPALLVFMGAVGLVLLIACANVANLTLARVASRERDVVIRAALGASRSRLVRQLLTESVVLALTGGALGVGVAIWGVRALQALGPGTIPRLGEIQVSGGALAFAVALSLTTGLLSGLVPALRLVRVDPRGGLAEGGRALAGSRSAGRTRAALVLGEVALASMLLVGAALLVRSFDRLQRVDLGFTTGGIVTARVTLPRSRYDDPGRQVAFTNDLLARLQAVPGATASALASDVPVGDGPPYWAFAVAGAEPQAPDVVQDAVVFRTSQDYFRTFGVPLVRGRLFEPGDRDGADAVALVSQSLAQRYWPGRDPIGGRVTFGDPADTSSTWMTIVGVVGDVRQEGPASAPYPQLYMPLAQVPSRSLVIAARTGGDPLRLVPDLKHAVAGVDGDLALSRIATMHDRLADAMARPRVNALLLGGFALAALVLAALGIYGVINYGVVQRTRELGIRVALGARAADVLRLVIRQGMAPVIAGLLLGLAGAAAASRVLRGLLYGVGTTDPITYAAVAGFLTAVALLASYLPARRAARADPVTALREE
ncbi:MAG TPA: ABC transporter permease [Gemmatimonadales bacterium]|nr:ABC transporter permease [Gemmatimonadales bacterium]